MKKTISFGVRPLFSILLALLFPLGTWSKTAYAVLSDNNTTLTFKYDNNLPADHNTSQSSAWTIDYVGWIRNPSITRVVFDASFADARPTDCSYWFYGLTNLASIEDLQYLNTSEATTMARMFYNCNSLTSLDLRWFDTGKVTDMSNMFYRYGYNLYDETPILFGNNFKTINVTDMSQMFCGCRRIGTLDLSNFNTSNVTSMDRMFQECEWLYDLNISSFNTANVEVMRGMFNGCRGLWSVDVNHFNTSKVTSLAGMFSGCWRFTSLDVSHFDTSNVTDMGYMFEKCSGLTSIDVSNFNTEKVTSMKRMFAGCLGLTSLDLRNFNTEKVTNMNGMFENCGKLTTLNLSNFNTENVTDMGGDISWPTYGMFAGCSSMKYLDLSHFNTKNVTNMYGMFMMYNSDTMDNSTDLEYILISNDWNTDNECDSRNMFNYCVKLPSFNSSTVDKTMTSTYCWNIDEDITIDGYTLYHDGYWSTLCLPFGVTTFAGTSLEGVTLKELDTENSHLTDRILTLTFKDATAIEAGKPYLVRWISGSNITTPTFAGNGTSSVTPQPVEFANNDGEGNCQFVGQFTSFPITEDNINEIIYIGSSNKIGYSQRERNLSRFRAHFSIPSTVGGVPSTSRIDINFGDGTTAIIPLTTEKCLNNNCWYTIDGRKLNSEPTNKGLYLLDGRKVIVR